GRDELLARLGETARPEQPAEPATPAPAGQPLPTDAAAFWSVGPLPDDLYGELKPPAVSAAWPKRLGNFPFWRGGEHFLDAVEAVYREASRRGLATFLGERAAGGEGEGRG